MSSSSAIFFFKPFMSVHNVTHVSFIVIIISVYALCITVKECGVSSLKTK